MPGRSSACSTTTGERRPGRRPAARSASRVCSASSGSPTRRWPRRHGTGSRRRSATGGAGRARARSASTPTAIRTSSSSGRSAGSTGGGPNGEPSWMPTSSRSGWPRPGALAPSTASTRSRWAASSRPPRALSRRATSSWIAPGSSRAPARGADAVPAKSCQGVLPPERRWSTHAQPRSAPVTTASGGRSGGRSPVTQLLGPPPGAGPELLAGIGAAGRLAGHHGRAPRPRPGPAPCWRPCRGRASAGRGRPGVAGPRGRRARPRRRPSPTRSSARPAPRPTAAGPAAAPPCGTCGCPS